MKVGSLFSGIGGMDLGFQMASYEIAWQVEKDEFCNKVLEKNFPNVRRYQDVKEVSGDELEKVDAVCGGFPCQPFSIAGHRRGKEDDRYLWSEMFRIIRELHPNWVLGENVANFANMALDETLADLESEGYETITFIIPAIAVDAPHRRDRTWIIAYAPDGYDSSQKSGNKQEREVDKSKGKRLFNEFGGQDLFTSNTDHERSKGKEFQAAGNQQCDNEPFNFENTNSVRRSGWRKERRQILECEITEDKITRSDSPLWNTKWERNWVEVATEFCRMDDGFSVRMDGFKLSKAKHRRERLKSLGNACVPQIVYVIASMIKQVSELERSARK